MVFLLICKMPLLLLNMIPCFAKPEHYGIRGIANEWFKSYLFDRKQFVSINGHVSNKVSVKYGIPQGSGLGSLFS